MSSEESRFILRANKLIGGVRLRQYRSGNYRASGGCTDTLEQLKGVPSIDSHGCYVPYSMDRQRLYVASLGGDQAYGPGKAYEGFQYKQGRDFNSFTVFSGSSFFDRSDEVTQSDSALHISFRWRSCILPPECEV